MATGPLSSTKPRTKDFGAFSMWHKVIERSDLFCHLLTTSPLVDCNFHTIRCTASRGFRALAFCRGRWKGKGTNTTEPRTNLLRSFFIWQPGTFLLRARRLKPTPPHPPFQALSPTRLPIRAIRIEKASTFLPATLQSPSLGGDGSFVHSPFSIIREWPEWPYRCVFRNKRHSPQSDISTAIFAEGAGPKPVSFGS